MNAIGAVFTKEVRENLRQRRTVLGALLYGPLIGPLFFAMMLTVMISMHESNAHKPLEIPVAGAQNAPNLIADLKGDGLVPMPLTSSPEQMIRTRKAKVVLSIPDNYADLARQGKPAEVDLYFDSSRRHVMTTVGRVRDLLQQWSKQRSGLRLLARGIAPQVATPLAVASRDQSTPHSRAGRFLSFLPYFFVIALFYGGMYLANDLTAGERERQSLEPLFANPVARWRILVGKLGAVCLFALASLVICLIGTTVVVHLVPTASLEVALDLGARFCAFSLLLYLPLAALIAVAQTVLAAFAKSYREAQSYLQIMMIVLIIPSALMSMVPIKASLWMYLVPVMGQQLGVSQLLRGDMPSALQVLCVFAGSVVATLLLGWITARIYLSERLAISA